MESNAWLRLDVSFSACPAVARFNSPTKFARSRFITAAVRSFTRLTFLEDSQQFFDGFNVSLVEILHVESIFDRTTHEQVVRIRWTNQISNLKSKETLDEQVSRPLLVLVRCRSHSRTHECSRASSSLEIGLAIVEISS